MKTEQDRLESLATAISKAAPDFDVEQQRIALDVYRRLAEGSPVPASEVAERSGVSTHRVDQLLAAWPGVHRDTDGRVVGFWGLTIHRLSPTHRLEVGGQELFAWCAWDTLFLPGILDATAHIKSSCPATAEAISLEVSPAGIVRTSHPGAAVSFLLPDRAFDADVIQSFCHFVHFFASEEAGRVWTAEHPGTFLLSLDDAFELGKLVNAKNFHSVLGGER
jgi:alkylmercury lyase